MRLAAFLLRCLLALALVAGGVPTIAMAAAGEVEQQASAMTSCHDSGQADASATDDVLAPTDCCGGSDCLCDCLQHMPGVVFSPPAITAPAFVASAPVSRLLQRYSLLPSTSLRPPIG